jgi:hypothetical protein
MYSLYWVVYILKGGMQVRSMVILRCDNKPCELCVFMSEWIMQSDHDDMYVHHIMIHIQQLWSILTNNEPKSWILAKICYFSVIRGIICPNEP